MALRCFVWVIYFDNALLNINVIPQKGQSVYNQ
jgi:hypothetical protein